MNRNLTRRRALARRVPAFVAGLTSSLITSSLITSSLITSSLITSSLVASTLAGAASAAPTASAVPAPASMDQAVAQTLAAKPAVGWTAVILKTTGPLTAAQKAKLHSLGADITRHLPIISSVTVHVPARSLRQVAALPFVTHLSLDGTVRKSDAFTIASSGAGAVYQQYGLTGQGVTVAVLDTGVHFDNDFAQTVQGGPSRILASKVYGTTNTDDFCGHGTHVAGIIAGNGAASTGTKFTQTFYGVARNASVVNVKVLGDHGEGSVSDVISGLQWVVLHQHDNKLSPIRVVNLSLGHPVGESYTTDPLCQAVEAAWKAGIVVVCAAGNEGRSSTVNTPGRANEGWGTNYGSIQSPGNDPYIITVGATKSINGNRGYDRIATYSSRGPSRLDLVLKPDILAPGNKVISTNTNNSYLAKNFGATNEIAQSVYTLKGQDDKYAKDYFCLSGTSMASPVVAGAAALLLQAYPKLTPDTVKARLMLSADKWADPSGNTDPLTYGAGYLNIPAALLSNATASLPALSPTLTANSDGSLSLVMSRAAWGSTTTTGSGLWGTGVTDLRAAWGSSFIAAGVGADRAAWGCNSLTSSRAAWGCSVWNDRAAWGCSTGAVDLTSTAIHGE